MAKYRKKPVVIEAFRWTGGPDQTEDPVWIGEAIKQNKVSIRRGSDPCMNIWTLEGNMRANVGDYIIRGTSGEIYPCKPDIFKRVYDLVE